MRLPLTNKQSGMNKGDTMKQASRLRTPRRASGPKLRITRKTVQKLGLDEMALVSGGASSASCCAKCDTDYTITGQQTNCSNNCGKCHDGS